MRAKNTLHGNPPLVCDLSPGLCSPGQGTQELLRQAQHKWVYVLLENYMYSTVPGHKDPLA